MLKKMTSLSISMTLLLTAAACGGAEPAGPSNNSSAADGSKSDTKGCECDHPFCDMGYG